MNQVPDRPRHSLRNAAIPTILKIKQPETGGFPASGCFVRTIANSRIVENWKHYSNADFIATVTPFHHYFHNAALHALLKNGGNAILRVDEME